MNSGARVSGFQKKSENIDEGLRRKGQETRVNDFDPIGALIMVQLQGKRIFPAFERERPRIVNNFAASASPGYEFSSSSDKMNDSRLSNLVMVLESATNTQTRTNRL